MIKRMNLNVIVVKKLDISIFSLANVEAITAKDAMLSITKKLANIEIYN